MVKLKSRNEPRAYVALLLILTLLGLGALDATICRGPDGHFSVNTHISSCCKLGMPEGPSMDSGDRDPSSSLNPCSGGAGCKDTPLIHGTLTALRNELGAGCSGSSITIYRPTLVASTLCETAPSFCTEAVLCRLRSTTLLI